MTTGEWQEEADLILFRCSHVFEERHRAYIWNLIFCFVRLLRLWCLSRFRDEVFTHFVKARVQRLESLSDASDHKLVRCLIWCSRMLLFAHIIDEREGLVHWESDLCQLVQRLHSQVLQIVDNDGRSPSIIVLFHEHRSRARADIDFRAKSVDLHNLEERAYLLREGLLVYIDDIVQS